MVAPRVAGERGVGGHRLVMLTGSQAGTCLRCCWKQRALMTVLPVILHHLGSRLNVQPEEAVALAVVALTSPVQTSRATSYSLQHLASSCIMPP